LKVINQSTALALHSSSISMCLLVDPGWCCSYWMWLN